MTDTANSIYKDTDPLTFPIALGVMKEIFPHAPIAPPPYWKFGKTEITIRLEDARNTEIWIRYSGTYDNETFDVSVLDSLDFPKNVGELRKILAHRVNGIPEERFFVHVKVTQETSVLEASGNPGETQSKPEVKDEIQVK